MIRWCGSLISSGLLLAGIVGCGRSDEKTVPVAGKVSYAGKALGTGTVIFRPDSSKGNASKHEGRGSIDAQGNYKLEMADKDGALVGWYKVGVVAIKKASASDPKPGGMPPPPVSLIPSKYGNPDSSGLQIQVKEKPSPGEYDITLSK